MTYILKDLMIDRVDLVDEGANSAAFIELYKRKECTESMTVEEIIAKMKPEHAEVISKALADKDAEITTATSELTKARDEIEVLNGTKCPKCGATLDADGKCPKCDYVATKACGGAKKTEKAAGSFDEAEVLKSMPDGVREMFLKMKEQRDAAEEQVRKAAEAKIEAEAIAKAADLKALPVEQDKLVGILKSCSPEVLEVLAAANAAVEGAVLGEVGKGRTNGADTNGSTATGAWAQIERKAEEIVKAKSVTKAKAVSIAIEENPELYRQYLEGGAN